MSDDIWASLADRFADGAYASERRWDDALSAVDARTEIGVLTGSSSAEPG